MMEKQVQHMHDEIIVSFLEDERLARRIDKNKMQEGSVPSRQSSSYFSFMSPPFQRPHRSPPRDVERASSQSNDVNRRKAMRGIASDSSSEVFPIKEEYLNLNQRSHNVHNQERYDAASLRERDLEAGRDLSDVGGAVEIPRLDSSNRFARDTPDELLSLSIISNDTETSRPVDGNEMCAGSFELFWVTHCLIYSKIALWCFYVGTSIMLVAIADFMYAVFLVNYSSYIGAWLGVATIGFSLVVGLPLAFFLTDEPDDDEAI